MKPKIEINIGKKILLWYYKHGRDLPFRKTKNAYKIWICEIIFQQTRIEQGLQHYLRFIQKFPDVETLYKANTEEVLLYWKGLGYYTRAINIHKAASQIMLDFEGEFPQKYEDILSLKGVGKYTAAAISSICFGVQKVAVDGNFYRVISRIFADDFNTSQSQAFDYFSQLALPLIPRKKAGDFNQAIMDLGSEICKPKNPKCNICPVNNDCKAHLTETEDQYPVKNKKINKQEISLKYYFVQFENQFLIKQRNTESIWKLLYDFPENDEDFSSHTITETETMVHLLTHKKLHIIFNQIVLNSIKELNYFAEKCHCIITDDQKYHAYTFPKPLEKYIQKRAQQIANN